MPDDLSTTIKDIQRRLAALETAPRLTNSSMSDPNGTDRIIIGQFSDGDYGLQINNPAGMTVYKAGQYGVTRPDYLLQLTQPNTYTDINSATFVTVWAATCTYVTADAIRFTIAVSADAATTGEVQITSNISGSPTTAVQTVPASTANGYEWNWAPPGLIVGTGPVIFSLQARRTSGTGLIHVYPPTQVLMSTSDVLRATATGI